MYAVETDNTLFSVELTDEPAKQGDSFSITLSPNRDDISAFILSVEYDSTAVTQVKAELTGTSNKDYLTFLNEDGAASLVYTAADSTLPKTGGIILRFSTDSSVSCEDLSLHFKITDAANSSAKKLLSKIESHTVNVTFPPLPSSNCTLLSLTPPAGTLTPDFDPDILKYTLEVPFSYTMLTFDTVPMDGAIVHVNRKNLGSGGTTVDFLFTVTAADGSTKTVYTVAVTRLEKETAANSASVSVKESGTNSADGMSSDSNAEAGQSAAASEQSVNTGGISETAAPNIYIYPESEMDPTVDRLITAAIVLLSVCAGAGIACLLQPHPDKNDSTKEDN